MRKGDDTINGEYINLETAKKLANKERVINILLSRIAKLEYEVERLENENNLLKQMVGNDKKYSYGIRVGSDKSEYR